MSIASSQLRKRKVAERQLTGIRQALQSLDVEVKVERRYVESDSPGSSVALWRGGGAPEYICGVSGCGEREKKAEQVGREAGERLLRILEQQHACDQTTLRQTLPLLALRGGSVYCGKVTDSLRGLMSLYEQFLDISFTCKAGVVSC